MPQPYNYSLDVQSPFDAALGGLKLGATFADVQAQREMQAQQQAAAQREAERQKMVQEKIQALAANPSPSAQDFINVSMLLPEKEAASMRANWDALSKDQQSTELRFGGQVMSAFSSGAPEVGINLLEERAKAEENSGRKDRAQAYRTYAEIAKTSPATAQKTIGIMLAGVPGGDKVLEGIVKVGEEARTAEKAPFELQKAKAEAEKAVIEAQNAVATAPDDVAKAKAQRRFEEAKADKEKVDADYAVKTKLAEIGLKQSQINKFNVEARNLTLEGKMLKLDFEAAANGLALPSKKTEASKGAATEDERKAAGWLAQAGNAYQNMLSAMYTKTGVATGAEKPGVIESIPGIGQALGGFARGTDRQKFVQASSSLSEALLRAATGAGVNESEARQKIEELSPVFTDDKETREQKLKAIPMYLESLKARAGRAAPEDFQMPQAPAPKGLQGQAKSSVVVGGKTYTRPANFTDAQWSAYKQAMGAQ